MAEPLPTVESLQRLLDEERRAHEEQYAKLRANFRLLQMSQAQWQQRAELAESKVKAIMQILGIA